MSRESVHIIQQEINSGLSVETIETLANTSNPNDVFNAVSGLIVQDLFTTPEFILMQDELKSISLEENELGINLQSIQTQTTKIILKYLANATEKYMTDHIEVRRLCESLSLDMNLILDATSTGVNILVRAARTSLYEVSDYESFLKTFKHLIKKGLNQIAAHSAAVISGDMTVHVLFNNTSQIGDKLKRFLLSFFYLYKC